MKLYTYLLPSILKIIVFSALCACVKQAPTPEPTPLIQASCKNSKNPKKQLVVSTSDYQVGILRRISLSNLTLDPKTVPIHQDAIVRAPAGNPQIFVVNRQNADSLQVIHRDSFETEFEFSVGRGMNFQDVSIQGDIAHVSRQNSKTLAQYSLKDGTLLNEITPPQSVEGVPLKLEDSFPDFHTLLEVNGKLIYTLQNLSGATLSPSEASYLLIYDLLTSKIEYRTLHFSNPYQEMKHSQSHFYISSVGQLGPGATPDGGIEKWKLNNFELESVIITEEELGGDIISFEITSSDLGFAIVSKADFSSRLVSFNPSTGKKLSEWGKEGTYSYHGLLYDEETSLLWVMDRSPQYPTVYALEVAKLSNEGHFEKLCEFDLGLPPYHMVMAE